MSPASVSAAPVAKLPHVDVLRGAAIAMVFFLHLYGATFWINAVPWKGMFPDYGAEHPASFWLFYGYTFGKLGVTLFFVLSGYCIHHSVLHSRHDAGLEQPLGARFLVWFFLRRTFRIYPAYLLALLFFALVFRPTALEGSDAKLQFLTHLFFVHNFFDSTFGGINGAFWSLAYEWQLYCLYPLILLLRRRWGMKGAFVLVALGSFVYTNAIGNLPEEYFAWKAAVFNSRYLFVWMLGACLCEWHSTGQRMFPRSRIAFLAASAIAVFATQFKPLAGLTWELFGVAFAWALELYRERRRLSLGERMLAGLGVISYSLYLFHAPLLDSWVWLARPLFLPGYPYNQLSIGGVGMLLVISGIAWLIYRYVECPFHRLGVRISKCASAPQPEAKITVDVVATARAPSET